MVKYLHNFSLQNQLRNCTNNCHDIQCMLHHWDKDLVYMPTLENKYNMINIAHEYVNNLSFLFNFKLRNS